MGAMNFIKNLAEGHLNNATNGIMATLINLDPETATEAQIASLSDEFDKASLEVAKAAADYEKEQKEADAIQVIYDKRLKAAEGLQVKLDTATDSAKPAIEASLNRLLSQIEEMVPDYGSYRILLD